MFTFYISRKLSAIEGTERIYAIIGILYEIYLIYYLTTNPLVIGIFVDPPLDINYVGLAMLWSLFAITTLGVSLLFFVRSGLKSDNPEVKLKAKFNLLAIISFVFGAVLDGYVSVNIVAVFIVRIILKNLKCLLPINKIIKISGISFKYF